MSNSFQKDWEDADLDTIASLAQKVVFRVPGCNDVEIRFALRSAYEDFCRLSSCYTHDRKIEIEEGVLEYPIPPVFPGCFVDSVTQVKQGNLVLVPGEHYRIETVSVPILFLRGSYVNTRTHSIVEFVEDLTVTAIDLPKQGSERVPHWFMNKYGNAVVSGALVKLFSMSHKPWSDPVQAQMEGLTWENYLSETRFRTVYTPDGASGAGAMSALDTSVLL